MRKLRPRIHARLRVGHQGCSCDTDIVFALEEPSTSGPQVSECALLEPPMGSGKCNIWGPRKSPGSRGGGIPLDPKPRCRGGTLAEPWWVSKGIFQLAVVERYFRQREQHKQSQGGRRELVGKEKEPGLCGSGVGGRE